MESRSLVQPARQLEFCETEELVGFLEIPEHPSLTVGYADIYHGFWTNPQGERVQVAVKQLRHLVPRSRPTDSEALKWRADMMRADIRLKREAFVWSHTTHPNLHPLLGYRSQPQPRLISPWCRHGNLTDYLRENPGLTRYDKLRLILQTACGLEHLHSRTPPICHANIKPENVLINDDHSVALSDSGLRRVVQDLEARSGFTTSETVKGNVRYMANELFVGQKPNLESDVYAFGGLILIVMSGKAPFDDVDLLHHAILRRMIVKEPPIPRDHPNLPAHDPLWELMRRCWDNDPTARPTMQEVLRNLPGESNREESNSGSRLHPASVTDDSAREYYDKDLDIPDTLQHREHLLMINRDNDNQVALGESDPHVTLKGTTQSVVQPTRQFLVSDTAEELTGVFDLPGDPQIRTRHADIYHGFWTNPQGVQVEVAAKQLRTLTPQRDQDSEAFERIAETRIKREVFVWSQTRHTYLHPLLGYSLQPRLRLISPWCRHGNLTQYLQKNARLSRSDKLRLIYQTAQGLEYLHSRKLPICHADIKPENVLINDLREAMLSDFGLSRVLEDIEASPGYTTTDRVKGTTRYMASELFCGQKQNLESDIYAFGGLILTVMSGKAPFEDLSDLTALRRVMFGERPTAEEHPNLPANDPLWKLILRCWDSTPKSRPSIREVTGELSREI